MLAPDHRFTRARMTPAAVVEWLRDPAAVKKDTLMPQFPMTEQERRDIATYILRAPLTPTSPVPAPARLPLLSRPVRYEEVARRVFKWTCHHCHANTDDKGRGGGPGGSGGFGFPPRKLTLSSYEGVVAGSIGADGKRASVLVAGPDGVPPIVARMLARHAEVAGEPIADIRGMPMAFPPVPMADIQLVDTWIAQGYRR